MVYGIGVDMVQVQRIKAALERFGDRFAEKVLGADELGQYLQRSSKAKFLAKRFAAKEATAKAFGTGFRDGLTLRQIQVCNNDLGAPRLCLSGRAEEMARERRIGECHISLTDDGRYALAFVTLTKS